MIKPQRKKYKVVQLLVCILLFSLAAASSIALAQTPDDANPDNPLISVSKTFSGLTQEQIDQLVDFKITITSKSDAVKTADLILCAGTKSVEANGDITYKWELEDWPAGTYQVTESGADLTYYDRTTLNAGTVTTTEATLIWDTALWKKPNMEEFNDLTKENNYKPPNIVATKLTQNRGIFIWTLTRQSASQRLAIVQALRSSFSELGLTEDNGNWYSGDDIAGNDFYFRGYRIQYDYETGILHIPQPNQWSLIVSGVYEHEGGDPADIAVTNTYARKTVDVTIKKVIKGNYGDLGRSFNFTAAVNGETFEFALGHSGSHTLTGLPAGETLILKEDSGDYDVTVMVGASEITPGGAGNDEYSIPLLEENITIDVTNNKDITINVGVSLDSLPYIIILAVVVIGLAVMIIRKRNMGKQD